jgi:hypothetical protein
MTPFATREALESLARPLAGRALLGRGGFMAGAALGALGLSAWLARLDLIRGPFWVPAAWLAATIAAGLVVWRWRRERTAHTAGGVARVLEQLGAWRTGALTGLLDRAAPGTSEELIGAADRSRAEEVRARGGAALEPMSLRLRHRQRQGGWVLAAGAALLVTAGPLQGAASALWHPIGALETAVAPVRLSASASALDRGEAVTLTVRAPGRRDAMLWTRAPGEGWQGRPVGLDSAGMARIASGPLVADLYARATSGGRSSDTVEVHVRLPAFLTGLTVTARYPSYLDLEDELLPLDGDSIPIPEGTRLAIAGGATTPLAAAVIRGPGGMDSLSVTGESFRGTVVPRRTGEYRFVLETASGAPLAGEDVSLRFRVLPDSTPTVDIPVPGADTLAPLGLTVPVVLDARDDHGLASATLVSRRVSRLGLVDPERRDPIPLPARVDRALLPFTLELGRRSLLPGDTVRYYALVTDNSPRGQVGRSREYVLRMPTLSEVRAAAQAATETMSGQLDSLVAASRQLERSTEDLAREQPRSGEGTGRESERSMTFDEARRAEALAARQDELVQRAEELKDAMADLQRAAEAAGLNDPEFQQRLQEIAEQLDRALTPEMREALEALRHAVSELDAARTKEALEEMAKSQQRLREALERSRELFERAAQEGELANLAQEARDLAAEQEQWNQAVEQMDSTRAAVEEEALARRTDSLASALQALAGEVSPGDSAGDKAERLEQIAQAAEQAAEQMSQAARSARQANPGQARRHGRRALEQLQPLAGQLDEERQERQDEWRQEVIDAIDRLLAETSRLAERQLEVSKGLREGAAPSVYRAEQGAVEEGVQKLGEQFRDVAGKHALIPPQIGANLETARRQMQQAREALASSTPNPREAGERSEGAVDALNAAAYQMLRARGEVAGAASGTGLAEMMQQMTRLAQQQGQLSQQGASLLPMVGPGGAQEQMRQLAAQQRALAEQLERMRAQGNSPAAAELAEEARDLARQLEAGRLDRRTVERQERLFRRMLDAGRTLQGEEQDEQKERQSTTARGDQVRLPPALRAQLEDETRRVRMPAWEELQRLSPEDRRLVLDYFRRLTEAPAP